LKNHKQVRFGKFLPKPQDIEKKNQQTEQEGEKGSPVEQAQKNRPGGFVHIPLSVLLL
jgi:hypothetical protein